MRLQSIAGGPPEDTLESVPWRGEHPDGSGAHERSARNPEAGLRYREVGRHNPTTRPFGRHFDPAWDESVGDVLRPRGIGTAPPVYVRDSVVGRLTAR